MKVLLDHDLPKALRLQFPGHLVLTARQMGWDALSNGHLIAAADLFEFNVLITADQKMFGEQSQVVRQTSLLVGDCQPIGLFVALCAGDTRGD